MITSQILSLLAPATLAVATTLPSSKYIPALPSPTYPPTINLTITTSYIHLLPPLLDSLFPLPSMRKCGTVSSNPRLHSPEVNQLARWSSSTAARESHTSTSARHSISLRNNRAGRSSITTSLVVGIVRDTPRVRAIRAFGPRSFLWTS